MALTRVAPAGIGSTPGIGITIGNSFLHTTGLESTNANFSGIVTAQSFRVTGDFQVDGTTTTLDTVVTEVDKLEVAANNNTVGVAITQSGTGDILNLYDGATEVFSVRDGGNVGIGTNNPSQKLQVNGAMFMAGDGQGDGQTGIEIGFGSPGVGTAHHRIRTAGGSGKNLSFETQTAVTGGNVLFKTSESERLRIDSSGEVTINNSDSNPSVLNLKGGGSTVSNGDEFAQVKFFTQDVNVSGSDRQCARISSIAENNHGSSSDAKTAIGFYTRRDESQSPVERLRITHGGLVGIGTDIPSSDLHISKLSANAEPTIKISSENSSIFLRTAGSTGSFPTGGVGNDGELIYLGGDFRFGIGTANKNLIFFNGSGYTERLRINSSGAVGIGTTNPSGVLHLQSTSANQNVLTISADNGRTAHIRSPFVSDSTTPFTFFTNNAWRFDVDSIRVLTMTHDYKVGIRTDNPTSNLTIAEDGASTNAELAINYTGSGNRTSAIRFQRGGTNYGYIAGAAFMLTTGAQDDLAIAPVSGKNLLFGIGNSEKVRISSSGLVGIGTDSMSSALQIYAADTGEGTAKGQITLKDTAAYNQTPTGGIVFQGHHTTGAQAIFAGIRGFKANTSNGDYDGCLAFDVRKHGAVAYEAMRINEHGQIGINTTNPGAKLSVWADDGVTDRDVFQVRSKTGAFNINVNDSDAANPEWSLRTYANEPIVFKQATTEICRVHSNANIGIGVSTPYYKLHLNTNNNATSLSSGSNGNWGSDGIRIENTNTTVGSMSLAHFRSYDADWHIGSKRVASNNSSFVFLSEGSEKLHIDVNGNVKIGSISDYTNNVTNCPVYIAMQTDMTDIQDGEGGATTGLLRIEETGSNNNRYHGIDLRNTNSGDIRILNQDVGISDRGDLVIAMPDGDANDGVHNKIRFNSLESSIQISGKGGAVAGNTSTEHTDIYIATKTGLTAVNTALGGEAAGLIRFEDKGSNDNRYHGIELRNRNSGDIRILNLDEGTTNKASLVFAIDNATTCAEAMRIKSSGVVKGSNGFIDGGSNAAGFFQLAASAGNTVVDTGISINASNGGGAMMVLASRNTSDQTATAAGMYLLDFRYNGNHVPGVTFIGGDNFCLFNKNGNNKLTVNCQSGNWSVAAFFAGYGIGNQL